jgi:hypothetical protein
MRRLLEAGSSRRLQTGSQCLESFTTAQTSARLACRELELCYKDDNVASY